MCSDKRMVKYGTRTALNSERSQLEVFLNSIASAPAATVYAPVSSDGTPGKKVRVLVADDHPVVRKGLSMLIGGHNNMEVVAECSNGQEALERYFECAPDVGLLDLRMPVMSGTEAVSAICQKDPASRLMIVSFSLGEEDIYQSFRAGARGYLPKDAPLNELFGSLLAVAAGETWVSAPVREALAKRVLEQELTPREMEVLRAMVAGRSNKEIGAALNISESTVKVHVTHILGKLKASGRTGAINIAARRGLVNMESAAA
jgi:two-component system, NarL family, response regulator